jgi:ABC-type transport system involved in Fe-S cluster assembly fused permease/ATPase subunit
MIDYIGQTGLVFKAGQKLTSNDLSKMNSVINDLVVAVNYLLKGIFNLNQELNDFNRKFDLNEAITLVSKNRRAKGMKIRYLAHNGKYVEFSYVGNSLELSDFTNENNWVDSISYIDGGEIQ